MARKFLYFIAILVVLVIAALVILRIWSTELTRFAFVPRGPVQDLTAIAPDAYASPDMWFSRPGRTGDDHTRFRPTGVVDKEPASRAAVFFIHPTSYLARDRWNGSLDDVDANRRAETFIKGMASAFNGNAQMWVPRYRQAAFGAFLGNGANADRAIGFAYRDIEAAFAAFLKEVPADRPIVLAGHSQGALHLLHLLKDHVKDTPVQQRVVAAYVIGWPVSMHHDLPATGLPPCDDPRQTGCLVSWQSYADPADPAALMEAYRAWPGLDGRPHGNDPMLCTNPLTGRKGGAAPASANLGTLRMGKDFMDAKPVASGELVPGSVPARCDARGILLIGDPPDLGPYVLPGNNYHVYDIPLFWANLRADVAGRAAAWQDTAMRAPAR